ncbi:MAG: hypothetical protein ACE5OZ_10280 [Candidatus Heimdallarchaeota archaeon]
MLDAPIGENDLAGKRDRRATVGTNEALIVIDLGDYPHVYQDLQKTGLAENSNEEVAGKLAIVAATVALWR